MTLAAKKHQTPKERICVSTKVTFAIGLLALLGYMSGGARGIEAWARMSDVEALSGLFLAVGPLAVVVLLAFAVVVSPIPSGPIAMAAGALYGPVEGGALTAVGALLGAMIAFGLSRNLGYRPLCVSNLALAKWITRPRTQFRLALAVLISRLIPFISFDAVSYIAGLTAIRMRNFAIATTVGILPASFAFAALGAGMTSLDNTVLMVAACGVTLVLPVGWFLAKRLRSAG